jgi:hypothetical protein
MSFKRVGSDCPANMGFFPGITSYPIHIMVAGLVNAVFAFI